jgi:hypothetical protein
MEIIERNNLVRGLIKNVKSFLRPIFYNGSSQTNQDLVDRTKTFKPVYSKTKNIEIIEI